MAKLVLTNPASFVSDASAVAQAGVNNAAIVAAIENTLSRDGTGPNPMLAPLDMNNQRILNLPTPASGLEPLRLVDFTTATSLVGALAKVNNLSDLTNVPQARANLGLGNVDNTADVTKNAAAVTLTNKTLTAPVINSPTGIVKGDVGLGNADNTSDVNKPVSTAQASAIIAAVGGAWINSRLAKTANYTVLNADKAATIALGGAAFYTLTFNAASGYDANFQVCVVNEDTARAKKMVVPGTTTFLLYPGQNVFVFNQNNVWKVSTLPRWKTPSGVTVFVDVTNGNDANDGLAAGAGNALATGTQAMSNVASFYDVDGPLTIQYADGTYTNVQFAAQTFVGRGSITIQGNTTTPANVLFNITTGVPGGNAFQFQLVPGTWTVQGFKITANAAVSAAGIYVEGGGCRVFYNSMNFGAMPGAYHVLSVGHGQVSNNGNYTISGGGAAHGFAGDQGELHIVTGAVTVTGTPAFTTAFVQIHGQGLIGITPAVFTGAATGPRWSASLLSLMDSGAPTTLPGSSNGSPTAAVLSSDGCWIN